VTDPLVPKPRVSCETLEVRPLSTSCLCLKQWPRARPLPLSSWPRVRTPTSVDLPESTLPTTATLSSMRPTPPSKGRSRTMASITLPVRPSRQCNTVTSAPAAAAILLNVDRDSVSSAASSPWGLPSSPTPSSYKASPRPSVNRYRSCVTRRSKRSSSTLTSLSLYSMLPSSLSGASCSAGPPKSESAGRSAMWRSSSECSGVTRLQVPGDGGRILSSSAIIVCCAGDAHPAPFPVRLHALREVAQYNALRKRPYPS
jgi:hypothetical protein